MVDKLQLTDEQVDQLRDLDFAHREKQQASKAELNNLRLQMDKAFTEDNVDKANVLQTAEKMADVKEQWDLAEDGQWPQDQSRQPDGTTCPAEDCCPVLRLP